MTSKAELFELAASLQSVTLNLDVGSPPREVTLQIRELSADARMDYVTEIDPPGEDQPVDLRLAQNLIFHLSVVGEDGELLTAREDLHQIGQLPSSLVDKVAEAARVLNGLTGKEAEALRGK